MGKPVLKKIEHEHNHCTFTFVVLLPIVNRIFNRFVHPLCDRQDIVMKYLCTNVHSYNNQGYKSKIKSPKLSNVPTALLGLLLHKEIR